MRGRGAEGVAATRSALLAYCIRVHKYTKLPNDENMLQVVGFGGLWWAWCMLRWAIQLPNSLIVLRVKNNGTTFDACILGATCIENLHRKQQCSVWETTTTHLSFSASKNESYAVVPFVEGIMGAASVTCPSGMSSGSTYLGHEGHMKDTRRTHEGHMKNTV